MAQKHEKLSAKRKVKARLRARRARRAHLDLVDGTVPEPGPKPRARKR